MAPTSQSVSSWEEEIAKRALAMPPPSSGAWLVYELLGDPEARADEVVEAAQVDPLFATELLRFANTAQFGYGQTDSLEAAATRVGYAKLRRHALIFAFRRLATKPLTSYGYSQADFYLRSVACASAMEALNGQSASAYTIGLLHGLGEVVIDAVICARRGEPILLQSSPRRRIADVEEGLLGLNQAQVAGLVLRRWRFPESVVAPIEQQFLVDPQSEHYEMAQALVMARFVANKILQVEHGSTTMLGQSKHIVYRGQALSDIFEYARSKSLELVRSIA